MLLAICTTQVKKKKKKKSEKEISENLLLGYSNPDTQNQLVLKANPSIYWTTSVNPEISSLKEVYIPSLRGLTVFKDDFFRCCCCCCCCF